MNTPTLEVGAKHSVLADMYSLNSMTLLHQYEYPQVWSLCSTNTSMPVAATVYQ
jgi:hypothetical protein